MAILLLASLWSTCWNPVQAESPAPSTVWRCWYNRDTRIECTLKLAPTIEGHSAHSVDPELPGIARQLWANAGRLAGERILIPLFNEPQDWDFTRLLAESVMCGANLASCRVEFSRNYAEAARLDPSLD